VGHVQESPYLHNGTDVDMTVQPLVTDVVRLKIDPLGSIVDSPGQAALLRRVVLDPRRLRGDTGVIVDVNDVDAFSVSAAEVLLVPWLHRSELDVEHRPPVAIETYSTTVRDSFDLALQRAGDYIYWLPRAPAKQQAVLIGDVPAYASVVVNSVRLLGANAYKSNLQDSTGAGADASDANLQELVKSGALIKDGEVYRVPFATAPTNGHQSSDDAATSMPAIRR